MAKLTFKGDPTLEAVDAALEEEGNREQARGYFGTHNVGEECSRKAWLNFRWADKPWFDAETLKRFEDGHAGEALQAARLGKVPGVDLKTYDPDTGEQFGFTDLDGHWKGHCDGQITGLLQAPKTPHIWEHKQVADKKLKQLEKAVNEVGESSALLNWDPVYYAQAQAYMLQFKFTRHYLTCSTPGGRRTISVRTYFDRDYALSLRTKAERIIKAESPDDLARVSTDPTFFKCKWCDYSDVCYGLSPPAAGCRTCIHSTPVEDGKWHCERWDSEIPGEAQQEGCDHHLYIPALLPKHEVNDVDSLEPFPAWIEYQSSSGLTWRNGVEHIQSADLARSGFGLLEMEGEFVDAAKKSLGQLGREK